MFLSAKQASFSPTNVCHGQGKTHVHPVQQRLKTPRKKARKEDHSNKEKTLKRHELCFNRN